MTNSETAPRNVRLRTACDECSIAKVKCTKTRPSCSRCAQLEQPCCYSASRKHGKQYWRQKAKLPRNTSYAPLQNAMPSNQSAWNDSMLGFHPPDFSNTVLPNIWPLGGGSVADIDFDAFADLDAGDLLSSGVSQIQSLNPPGSNKAMVGGSGTIEVRPAPRDSPSAPPSLTASSFTANSHDCEDRALSILRSMHHGALSEGATCCDTRVMNLTPSFDRVLALNQAALEGWRKVMACQCAMCPYLISLHVSILSKMLFWYHVAALERPARTPSNDGSGSDASSPEPPPTYDQFGVVPTAVRVGALSVDPEEQAIIRRRLLLLDLRKMEQAMGELLEQDRRIIDPNVPESMHFSIQWSLGGVERLKEEVKGLIEKVNLGQ